jgi:hypothetical protein
MTEFFATIAGAHCQKVDLYAGQTGPWYLDAILDDTSENVTGRVLVQLGTQQLVGTVIPAFSGAFVLQRSLRVIAGNGGWGTLLKPKAYHDDGGVSYLTVATDAARECGETLGSTDFGPGHLGTDFVRGGDHGLGIGMPGSAVLERLLKDSGGQWWVDQGGITHCGKRPLLTPKDGSYNLLTYSAVNRTAVIGLDDPASLWVGSVLTDRLSDPQTIRELELHIDANQCRLRAWTGGDASDTSRLDAAFESWLEQREARRVFGKYRYRVFAMSGNRANLQASQSLAGLPDVMLASLRPGVAGMFAKLKPGSEVLVEFIAGDITQPICTGFPSRDDPNYLPDALELCVAPGKTGRPSAGEGDTVDVFFPPEIPFTGIITPPGSPVTGVLTIVTSAPGVINSGSDLVSVGNSS